MELEKYRNDQELRSKSKFSCKYGGARRDREPSRLQCKKIIKMFKKSKSSRKCIKRYNSPYSSAMKNFLSIDFRIYLTTRLCRSRPVGRNTCSAYCCVTHHIYLVKTRTSKHKNMDVLLCVDDSCGLNNCYSIKCNKQQEKYCLSRANIFTSGDIELNPGIIGEKNCGSTLKLYLQGRLHFWRYFTCNKYIDWRLQLELKGSPM